MRAGRGDVQVRRLEPWLTKGREVARFIACRKFDADGKLIETHGNYPKATREIAEQETVALLDRNARSLELLTKPGPEPSKRLFGWMVPDEFDRYPKGLSDDTHLNTFGACRICDQAVKLKTAIN